jgi:Skp family chaperone for outer membrane proteins
MTKTFLSVLVLGAVGGAALAQQPADKASGLGSAKVAVIDMQRISSESLMGKGYASQLESLQNEINAEGTKKQNELQKMDAAIKALNDELEKQGSVLSPEGAEKKRQEIVKKQRDRQAFLEDGQAELQRMRERATQQAQALNNEFQNRIKPHIDAVAREKGVDIIIYDGALSVNKAFDISQEVIVKADEAERSGKAKGASGSPAPKPAGTPAPKPAVTPAPKPTPTPSPKP